MKQIPEDWFVCPVTKQKLVTQGACLVSEDGRYLRDSEHGFCNFIPDNLDRLNAPEWRTWDILQDNSTVSYARDPEHNLMVDDRPDVLMFAEFAQFRGNILDIGCGPQALPTHMRRCTESDAFFVGIDPLRGEQPREFAYVRGLGEYLPFRDNLFDQAIFVTSLDHFIDPVEVLVEAKRVVRGDGDVVVWMGEKAVDAPKPTVSHEWYDKLVVPEGAEDRFHFKRFSIDEFQRYAREAGLHIVEDACHKLDDYRSNYFCRLKK